MAQVHYNENLCSESHAEITFIDSSKFSTDQDLNELSILHPYNETENEDTVNRIIYNESIGIDDNEGKSLNLFSEPSLQFTGVAELDKEDEAVRIFHTEDLASETCESRVDFNAVREFNNCLTEGEFICKRVHEVDNSNVPSCRKIREKGNFTCMNSMTLREASTASKSQSSEDPEKQIKPKQPAAPYVDKQVLSTSLSLSQDALRLSASSENLSQTGSSTTNCAIVSGCNGDDESRKNTLLRGMISTPLARSSVSISSVPRQDLSTASVPQDNQESSSKPKSNIANKLDKEIRCLCKHNNGKPCWMLFQEEHLRKERLHHLNMKRETLDLVILAKVAANINREEQTRYCPSKARQRSRVNYLHEGRQICRETFMFIHGICKSRLSALITHYKNKGLTTRVHKNVNTVPKHALSSEDTNNMLDFVRDYANKHCASSFGRKPDSKAGGGLLIMSKDQSKRFVHHKYKTWCSQRGMRAVALRSFQMLWNKHLPYIVVLRGSNKCAVPEAGDDDGTCEFSDSEEHTAEADDSLNCREKSVPPSDSVLNEAVACYSANSTPAVSEPFYVNRGTSTDYVLLPDIDGVHNKRLTNSNTSCLSPSVSDKLPPSEILITIVPSSSTPGERFCYSSEDNVPNDSFLPRSFTPPLAPPEHQSIFIDPNPPSHGIGSVETSDTGSHLLFSHSTPLQSSLISDKDPPIALHGHMQSQPLFTALPSIQTTDPTALLPQSHDLTLPLEVVTLADYQPLLLAQAAGTDNLGQTRDWHPWTPFTSN
ncbi:hypothetical protein EGW08_000292 [Elysia chlorotica]|uniref:DNA primase/nucleoside triphosphatase C-terminal domain-containing protein n=1 Tax=Elysia chlorotica TaxID=188477 RepID=A0A3S1BUH6_ELYCH|nr:hypothetical protein EGW08_000292 [Elysia chlorotica]